MTSIPAPTPYRGVDRRAAAPAVRSDGMTTWRWAPAVLVLALVAAVAAELAHGPWTAAMEDLRPVLRASFMTGGGILCLVRWRLTGRTTPALVGTALVVLGVLTEAVVVASPAFDAGGGSFPGAVLRTVPALLAAALVVWSRRAQDVDTAAHPTRILVAVLVLVPAGCTLVVLLARQLEATSAATLDATAAAWRAGLWLALAATQRPSRGGSRTPWLVVVFGLLTMASVSHAVGALGMPAARAAVAVFSVAAGLAAVQGAAGDLLRSLSDQSYRLLHLTADVTEHERRRRTAQESEAVRLHEVRNVLAGLHGATATLRRYEDKLDPGVRHRLEDAISGELARLQHLIDPPAKRPSEPVLVSEALDPVLVAERELGASIRADLPAVRALGCAADIATICSILLVNARTHAPGAPVLLRARTAGDTVEIAVDDGGPGVPEELREAVFRRGERGRATAPGSGLGLFHARELAEQMGGRLALAERPLGGASFVLTLPSAQPGQRIPQQRQRRAAARS